jgi:hypothetical protein
MHLQPSAIARPDATAGWALADRYAITATLRKCYRPRYPPIWAAAGIEFLRGTIAQIGLICVITGRRGVSPAANARRADGGSMGTPGLLPLCGGGRLGDWPAAVIRMASQACVDAFPVVGGEVKRARARIGAGSVGHAGRRGFRCAGRSRVPARRCAASLTCTAAGRWPLPGPARAEAGARRRTGIEPADGAARRPPVLKTGGATRHPDASSADVTRARAAPAIRPAPRPAGPWNGRGTGLHWAA